VRRFKKFRPILRSRKSPSPGPSQRQCFFSRTLHFLGVLIKKFARSARFDSWLNRIFVQPRSLLVVRQFRPIVKFHLSPRLEYGAFTRFEGITRNQTEHKWLALQVIKGPESADSKRASRGMEGVFARQARPIRSTMSYWDNVAAILSKSPPRPVPLVFLRSSHPSNGEGIPAAAGTKYDVAMEKQVPQSRFAGFDFAPEQITRLTDQVLQTIDRRIVAQRERWGRV